MSAFLLLLIQEPVVKKALVEEKTDEYRRSDSRCEDHRR